MAPSDLSEPDLHWLAGLLEGEGSFMAGPPSNPRAPVLVLIMNDHDVVARLGRIFGRKVMTVRARQAHWNTSYQVRIAGGKAVAWMTALRPLLGLRRQAQVDRALACYDPRPTALLDEAAARSALAALDAGETVKSVAARYGVSVWCIYDLRLGRTHKHIPRPHLGSR